MSSFLAFLVTQSAWHFKPRANKGKGPPSSVGCRAGTQWLSNGNQTIHHHFPRSVFEDFLGGGAQLVKLRGLPWSYTRQSLLSHLSKQVSFYKRTLLRQRNSIGADRVLGPHTNDLGSIPNIPNGSLRTTRSAPPFPQKEFLSLARARDSTAGRVTALHVADPELIPGIPQVPWSTARNKP